MAHFLLFGIVYGAAFGSGHFVKLRHWPGAIGMGLIAVAGLYVYFILPPGL